MNRKIRFILLVLMIITVSCKKAEKIKPIPYGGLQEKSITITNTKKFEGFVIGASFERDELYVQSLSAKTGQYAVQIINTQSMAIKKEMALKKGVMESPTEFYAPSYMQFLDDNYIIVDQNDKILVYDQYLNYLYTNMFHNQRFFIDFYSYEKKKFFVIGIRSRRLGFVENNIQIFQLPEKKRPIHANDLYVFSNESQLSKSKQDRKALYIGSFWPSGIGFYKNGKIYYANNDEQRYYVYDLKTNKTTPMGLNFLTPKKYSQEEAEKFIFYNSDGWEERMFNKTGTRVVAEAYSKPIYHFGIYDVGANKIGIIGDIDTKKIEFRLDILDANTGRYWESIRLPFGNGFTQAISTDARGMCLTYINVDKGYYLWGNSEGADSDDFAFITTFKINSTRATVK